jgi:hypothetical protein
MSVKQTDNLPDDLCKPPGFLGALIEHMNETAEFSYPEFFLAASLSLLATISGRKIQDYRGTRPNLFCVSIGPSGCGKNHARKVVQKILAHTNLEGPEKFTAGSAIVNALSKSPSLLCQIDEMGQYLKAACGERASAHLKSVLDTLMTCFTSSDLLWKPTGYANDDNTKVVDQPNLCIHGTTTPESFFKAISGDEIASGFFGRLMLFLSPGLNHAQMQDYEELKPVPERIATFVERWLNMPCGPGNLSDSSPDPPVVPITPEAKERVRGHIAGISSTRIGEHPIDAALWSRASEKTSKLALLHTISRSSSIIELQDVDWAIAVVNFMTRRMIALVKGNVASTDHERKVQRIVRIVADAGNLISLREFNRRTQWLPSRERAEILSQVKDAGLLFECVVTTKGREAHGLALSIADIESQGWTLLTEEMIQAAIIKEKQRIKELQKL